MLMQKLSDFYKSIFGCKAYKLSLDAGCTCPNRDGSKGTGGCIFCSESGSGDFAAGRKLSITEQVEAAKTLVEAKLRGRSGERRGVYIAYFQNFTSTYGDSKALLAKYQEALSCEDVKGLALATRPDCLGEEILSGLARLSQNHFVQLELGLQTSNESTGHLINRCYTNADYLEAVRRIQAAAPSIHIVTHLIFGLPGDTEKDMLNSVSFVVNANKSELSSESHKICMPDSKVVASLDLPRQSPFGLKITVLYVVKNTRLAQLYQDGKYQPLSKDEYFSLLKKTLPLLPEDCVLHRLTGDPPKSLLIAPAWPADKKRVLNELKGLLEKL